jgi:transcriptional regulator with XRE-family HTH domain
MDGQAMSEGAFHYTDSGLDYVFLTDGYKMRETKRGVSVAIERIDELHAGIAKFIVTMPYPLRGQEVRFLRSMLGYSQEELGRKLGVRRNAVAVYERDRMKAIPAQSDHLLRMFYAMEMFRKRPDAAEFQELNSKILDNLEVAGDGVDEEARRTTFTPTEAGWAGQGAPPRNWSGHPTLGG